MADSNPANPFETFKLGDVELQGFEVPELVPLGGDQAHAVKDFPGGYRQVQSFGYHRRPLTWSGILVGPEALKRHQALEALCDSGEAVLWSFGNQLADVLVTRYHPDLLDRYEIHYALEMVVIVDHSKPPPAQVPDADTQILAGLQQATAAFDIQAGIWPPIGLSALFAQWAINMDWTHPWSDLAQHTLNFLVFAAQNLEANLERFIDPLAKEAALIADLEALLAASEALSGVRISRLAIATYLLGRGAPGVWVAGTSVWELGSRFYGDAAKGVDILVGNNLRDTAIDRPAQIAVPPSLKPFVASPSGAFAP